MGTAGGTRVGSGVLHSLVHAQGLRAVLVQQSSALSGKATQPLILAVFLYLFLGDLCELKMPPSCQKGPGKHLSPRGHQEFYYFFQLGLAGGMRKLARAVVTNMFSRTGGKQSPEQIQVACRRGVKRSQLEGEPKMWGGAWSLHAAGAVWMGRKAGQI